MGETVKDRLIKYLLLKKISQRSFEVKIGLSNGYINNIRKSIQPDKLQNILLNYPDLNIEWLLTGKGEMLKNDHNQDVEKDKIDSDANENTKRVNTADFRNEFSEMINLQKSMQEILKTSQHHLSESQKQVNALLEILKKEKD